MWNSLPEEVVQAKTVSSFKACLVCLCIKQLESPLCFSKLMGKQEMVNAMVNKAFLHKHHQLE